MKLRTLAAALLIFLFPALLNAQTAGQEKVAGSTGDSAGSGFFPLSDLKPGMKGKAWTVFRGSEAEEFDVEIIGVVPGGIGPKQDLIVGRISGGQADRTRVFAGMSGSPVYIGGRLVGAIAYSFPFSKEGTCGITPIEQMIGIFESNREPGSRPAKPRTFSFAELAAAEWLPQRPAAKAGTAPYGGITNPVPGLTAVAGRTFQPIALPLAFSGFSQATLDQYASRLIAAGLLPVSSLGGAARMGPLKPADKTTLVGGDSVAMHLTRGDFSMTASGTVTYRDGDRIYAFGHPFLSLGASDLPMSESHVVTVVPSLNNSFKLAVPDAMVGSMTQDRATGVFGRLGKTPKMIPVTLNLTTSRNRKEVFRFEIANDQILTPLLLNMAVFNSITSTERSLGDLTIEVDGMIRVAGHDPVRVDSRFTGQTASRFAAASMVVPVGNLLRSRFSDLDIEGITVDLRSRDGGSTAKIERIAVNKTEARAGEILEIRAFVRTDTGRLFTQKIHFSIPADTPAGILTVEIGDGNALQKKTAAQQFVPKNLSELITTINGIKKGDRLYLQAYRTTKGAIIGVNEMPNLPPSVLATMNNNRTAGGFTPTVTTVVSEQEIPPAEFIVTGQRSLTIRVIN